MRTCRVTAEYSFETNAAPVGGYVDSDLRQITAGKDRVLLQTMAWTDDFEDLPMTYEFGYVPGWVEVRSSSRCDDCNSCPTTFHDDKLGRHKALCARSVPSCWHSCPA